MNKSCTLYMSSYRLQQLNLLTCSIQIQFELGYDRFWVGGGGGKNKVFSFENTFECFERLCQGVGFIFPKIRSFYG